MASFAGSDPAALNLATKILSNIVSNPSEAKFRSINLGGKAGAKLVAAPGVLSFLQESGFVQDGSNLVFPTEASVPALAAALGDLQAAIPPPPVATPVQSATPVDPYAGMSLKQKAVAMAEAEAKADRENAKKLRAQELAKLEQDKLVRQKDENWKPAAAGVKGGKAIETYRGKYGEDQGGG